MFEKEAEEYAENREVCGLLDAISEDLQNYDYGTVAHYNIDPLVEECFKDGAEFGYNKAKEDVKHDLMMKLKDEGIVKPLKDSIFSNKKLSSQEQQELCAWIECAMDFGENLDECAKELEEANKANEWHYVKDGLPSEDGRYLVCNIFSNNYVATNIAEFNSKNGIFGCIDNSTIYAWKEIVLPGGD